MSKINVAGFITTNVDVRSLNEGFLAAFSVMLAKVLNTSIEFITLELQTSVVMLRAGSSAPMLTVRLFHNSNKVDNDTKHDLAKQVAGWMARQIRVPEDRVLVLFLDTRLCNAM